MALAKSAAINLGTGTLQPLVENPDANFADLAQAGKENIAAALGLHAAGHVVGQAYGKAKDLVTGKGKPDGGGGSHADAGPDTSIPALPLEKQTIPDNTTAKVTGSAKPPSAPPSGPPPDLQTAQARIHNIMNRPPEQRGHPTTQADLAQAQQVVADHVQRLESQPGPRSDARQKELDASKAALSRLEPMEGTATSTHSSGGGQPAGSTASTNGDMPTEGHVTGTMDAGTTTFTTGAGGQTSTASANATTSPGGGTHTTNGVKAPPVGHGNLIPENTTHPDHLDLATRRVENLEEVARKRPLDSHEQGIYDNARRIRDRNTGNPQELVMAGGDGPISQTHGAATEVPTAAHVQAPNAVGTAIEGSGTTNPDAPTTSAGETMTLHSGEPAGIQKSIGYDGNGNPVSADNSAPANSLGTDSDHSAGSKREQTNDTKSPISSSSLPTHENAGASIENKKHLTGTTRDSIDHKLDTYLLNPDHKLGGAKAKWFKEALGITRENAGHLADQIVFDPKTAVATDKTQHGQKYEQTIHIHGTNGRTIPVNMVWIRNLDGVVRYVTAIPTKHKK